MIFKKNRFRVLVFAILALLNISITNVWGMLYQAAAAAAGCSSPVPRVAADRSVPQSVPAVAQKTPNICSDIIKALNDGDVQEAKKLLVNFYRKIPSFLKESPRYFDSNMRLEDRKESKKSDSFKFHVSLFYCLAMCISNSCDDDIIDYSKEKDQVNIRRLKSNITINGNEQYARRIQLNVKTCQDKKYSIIFDLSMVDSGALALDIRIDQISNETSDFVDISRGYNSGQNFFKKTTTALVPSSSSGRDCSGVSTFSLNGSVVQSDYTAQSTDIENRLYLIFKVIPFEYRVHLERYSQFVLSSLINFMGSYICDIECPAGEGRADLVVKTERDREFSGCIIELKRGGNADAPMSQIEKKFYARYFGVGLNVTALALSIMTSEERDLVIIKCIMHRETLEPSADDTIIYYIPDSDAPKTVTTTMVAPQVAAAAPQPPSTKKRKKTDEVKSSSEFDSSSDD